MGFSEILGCKDYSGRLLQPLSLGCYEQTVLKKNILKVEYCLMYLLGFLRACSKAEAPVDFGSKMYIITSSVWC